MFYVGQKVVAIKDHAEGAFKKGDEFIVKDIRGNFCKCCDTLIDIGMQRIGNGLECLICGEIEDVSGIKWWFKSNQFAPLETYRESYSIAIQLIQELEQVDKQKIFNPEKIKA